MDGLPVGPLYPPSSGPIVAARAPASPWSVVQRIDRGDREAIRAAAADAIRGGATGIELVFAAADATHRRGGIDPGMRLDGLIPSAGAILRIDAGDKSPGIARHMASFDGPIACVYDPGARMALRGGAGMTVDEGTDEIARLVDLLDREDRAGLAVSADGRPWHDGGASEVQELAVVTASAVMSLRRLGVRGIDTARVWRRLGISLSADSDQFLTIAKFRAVRLLFARLAEVLGVGGVRPPVHAETAWRMIARRDPTMNMIRATTAVFAAGVGGADSVTVLPPQFEDASFDARMARNTQSLLLEESALSRESDPGAGAGAIEALTAELAASAWDLFTRIEGEGGLDAALRSGSIQGSVAAMRDRRLKSVACREIVLVGVNAYVDPTAPIPPDLPADPAPVETVMDLLRPIRLAEPFERLFARSRSADGTRLAVLLVGSGREDGRSAPADAFAAGGFVVVPARESADGPTLAEVLRRSGARLACVSVGAKGWEPAAATAAALRAAGAAIVTAAADSDEGAPASGFDAVLTPRTDVVTFLGGLLDRIAVAEENGQS